LGEYLQTYGGGDDKSNSRNTSNDKSIIHKICYGKYIPKTFKKRAMKKLFLKKGKIISFTKKMRCSEKIVAVQEETPNITPTTKRKLETLQAQKIVQKRVHTKIDSPKVIPATTLVS